MNIKLLSTIGLIALGQILYAQKTEKTNTITRPDAHAPILIMGDHVHHKGEWMFSYRYMFMSMEGNIQGRNKVSNNEVFEKYMVSPQKMNMSMHMLGLMYAPSDKITLMLMGNYLFNDMDLLMQMPMNNMMSNMRSPELNTMQQNFNTQSFGFGDLSLSALVNLKKWNSNRLHSQFGLYIPTGSINQKNTTPMSSGNKVLLGYPMQLGSGSWNPFIGLTYTGKNKNYSWGVQTKYTFRVMDNRMNYRFGNALNNYLWIAKPLSDNLSISVDIQNKQQQKIKGMHKDLNPTMMPLMNIENSGFNQFWSGLGINYLMQKGKLKGLRIAINGQIPIWQYVNGIQMRNQLQSTIGLQYAL